MTKKSRHISIIQILQEENIINQDVLLNKLTDKGYELTQATLSRDMKELKIVKTPLPNGVYAYKPSEETMEEDTTPITTLGFLSIEFSGQLAVMKTRPGYAMAIASEIDRKATNYILGTVAGDDTILLIPKENVTRESVIESLATFIPNIK